MPVFVAAGSALAGRAVAGPAAWTGFAVALGGVALVAGSGGDASLLGDALVLASAVLGAALIVVQGGLLEGRDPVAVTAVQMGAAGLFALAGRAAGAAARRRRRRRRRRSRWARSSASAR